MPSSLVCRQVASSPDIASQADDHLDEMELDAARDASREGKADAKLKRKSGSLASIDSARGADTSVHSGRSGRGSRTLAGLVETRKLRVDNLRVCIFCATTWGQPLGLTIRVLKIGSFSIDLKLQWQLVLQVLALTTRLCGTCSPSIHLDH